MALRLKNGLVFLHIPHTGGTSVILYLRKADLLESKHNLARVADFPSWPMRTETDSAVIIEHSNAEAVGEDPERCFTFVRHPMAWCRSRWARMVGQAGGVEEFARAEPGPDEIDREGNGDFETWMRQRLDAYPEGMVSMVFRRYTEGLLPGRIGRTGTLQRDLARILNVERMSLGRYNCGNPQYLAMARCSRATEVQFRRQERWVFETFGYAEDQDQ